MEGDFIWLRVLQARAYMAVPWLDMTRFTRYVSPYPLSYSSPPPVGLGRGAQAKADQGSRLSEAKPSLSETPLLPSTAGCPEQSGGTQTIGSLFFSLGFFGETKKSKSPAGARPGLHEAPSS